MEKLVFLPDEKMKDYYRLIAGIIYLILFVPGIIILPFYPVAGIIYLTPIVIIALFTFYWISLFYKSLKYTVTDEHVIVNIGVWWKKETIVPMEMITNIDKTQNPFERRYGIGKIHAQTAGAGGPQAAKAEAVVLGIKNMDEIKNEIAIRAKKSKVSKKTRTEEEILTEILKVLKEILKK